MIWGCSHYFWKHPCISNLKSGEIPAIAMWSFTRGKKTRNTFRIKRLEESFLVQMFLACLYAQVCSFFWIVLCHKLPENLRMNNQGGLMKSIDSLPKQLPLCLFDREIVRQGQVHWQWRQRENTPEVFHSSKSPWKMTGWKITILL